jgi:transaldolase / glucose-6-phosphate isomerase
LLGKVAIANAKLAYQAYKRIIAQDRWQKLAKKGAQTQRLLWASTGTKNPSYSDTLYVEELVGADTVNTVPPATYECFKDHGKPHSTLERDLDKAEATMQNLKKIGISMNDVCDKLVVEGVKLFADAFSQLLAALSKKRENLASVHLDTISYHLDKKLTEAVHAALDDWRTHNKTQRLWSRDSSLWTNTDESKWLGWLDITYDQVAHMAPLAALAEDIKKTGFKQVLLLGMGGSSLGPEVLAKTFGRAPGYPELLVLDSTDPAQVLAFEKQIDLKNTLFIVSSKSGTTLEPNIFKQYFFEKVKAQLGAVEAGKRFIAITDPGSQLEKSAFADGFRYVFHGLPSIGGRYSVLSNFGMVPAAVLGLDLANFLNRTDLMVHACAASVPPENNPGVMLGVVMGVLHNHGRNKVTIVASPALAKFGAWLEQLLAESTGKIGKGLIPIDNEPMGSPSVAGNDRLFVYVRLHSQPNPEQDKAMEALEEAGQPLVRLSVDDIHDLGQEFFRWEIATATAGSLIGINAFNQPDVEASKIATRDLTSEYEKTGHLPSEAPFFEADGIEFFADAANAEEIKKSAASGKTLTDHLKAHLTRLKPGDYFALLAYLEMNEKHEGVLQQIRRSVRDSKKVATCLGFGPRFLHSTGQAYKGGPNSGVFLQITVADSVDVPVPGQKYTFGIVKAAQARGDFKVLVERKRRALRLHLTGDIQAGLNKLYEAVQQALK